VTHLSPPLIYAWRTRPKRDRGRRWRPHYEGPLIVVWQLRLLSNGACCWFRFECVPVQRRVGLSRQWFVPEVASGFEVVQLKKLIHLGHDCVWPSTLSDPPNTHVAPAWVEILRRRGKLKHLAEPFREALAVVVMGGP